MFTISLANEGDGQSILGIAARSGVFTSDEVACVQELWEAYLRDGEASGYVFLVYKGEDGQALAFLCFGPTPLTEGTFDLYWVCVAPEARGRGIASVMLTRMELEVAQRGGRLILVETSSLAAYAAARGLYESRGYQREAVVHDFYSPGDDLVILQKHLGGGHAEAPASAPVTDALPSAS
ncbi:MAG: GNAT family N-acetyltransferase [Chloroflexi bacterium]|nr:GNAT family N-acetyltransferase [Chloroflexota bacterium]